MSRLLPYEEIIAKKMEELPIPDMQNGIWIAVLLELNTSVPEIAVKNKTITKKISLGILSLSFSFIISLLIIVVVIVASQNKSAKREPSLKQKTIQPIPPRIDSSANKNKKDSILIPFNKQKENHTIIPGSNVDSIACLTSPDIIPVKIDSGLVAVSVLPLTKDSGIQQPLKPVQKKTIGVIGISDSSYRISRKKDSL